MDDVYDINFQSNSGFCQIRIRYNSIVHGGPLVKVWSTVTFAVLITYIDLVQLIFSNYTAVSHL
jgi:hypothetical protein